MSRSVELEEIKRGTDYMFKVRLWSDRTKTARGDWDGTYLSQLIDEEADVITEMDVDVSGAANGELVVSLDPVATAALRGDAVLEWRFTELTPQITQLLHGRIPTSKDVFAP